MKIAIPYENGEVFQHFGHTAAFMIYQIEAGRVVSNALLPANGSGHGALAGLLAANGVEALVCGGIGGGARTALAAAGIAVYPGVSGAADGAAAALAAGSLAFDPNAACAHHAGHGEGHDCGSHGEGHSCAGGHCGG
ncbi:MAG TPA: NifB/NifX family molybdenum-iron cluster-binding protein [Candidatus Fournierella merdigallinarum]|nr:NifB/NifX family molybdenum-iron cluster-binding protein [Candidatus Fournierella merdigallinarum]